MKTDTQEEIGKLEGLDFDTSQWNYFAIIETSDYMSTNRNILLNNLTSDVVTLDSVTTGPLDGKMFIGSYDGYLKFFEGFIWNFEYYVSNKAAVSDECDGFCAFCPPGIGCLLTCSFDEFVGEE
jgi:hypothetical protein